MKATLLTACLLAGFAGLIGGCYYHEVDDYRGYRRDRNSYWDGFRRGRSYEDRRNDWRDYRYRQRYPRDD